MLLKSPLGGGDNDHNDSMGRGGVKKVGKKNALSPFFVASRNKNVGATIRIGREFWCLPYAGFFKSVIHVLHSGKQSNSPPPKKKCLNSNLLRHSTLGISLKRSEIIKMVYFWPPLDS